LLEGRKLLDVEFVEALAERIRIEVGHGSPLMIFIVGLWLVEPCASLTEMPGFARYLRLVKCT
jgi:hypothetical protein